MLVTRVGQNLTSPMRPGTGPPMWDDQPVRDDDPLASSAHDWLDHEAGPVVRPYAMTGGRATPVAGGFDLVALRRGR